ncbi:hypothetical protein HPB50_013247 [Hyalomma asiaticum]|uniref:Uncharacterized protein n=1 Tax=Hyalomma asiaticum TaxID=266040 RepID=A0ACB7RIX3_HYAAI|nr:hypothetical protein HPB50_013247 [Hyalomma asiaticum]
MLAAAWMSTRQEVVKNCFAHAGFRPEEMSLGSSSDDAQAADDIGPAQDAATGAAREALEEAGIVPESVALSAYVNANADMIVYEELSDAETLKSARAAAAADSSDDEVGHDVPKVSMPVTASQVMDSLDIICSFLGTHDDDVAMQLLTECPEDGLLPVGTPHLYGGYLPPPLQVLPFGAPLQSPHVDPTSSGLPSSHRPGYFHHK